MMLKIVKLSFKASEKCLVHIYFIKPDKDSSRKEHCRPVILMNTGTKILNKMRGDRIQQCYVERIVHHNHCGLSQEQKAGSVFQNQEIESTMLTV